MRLIISFIMNFNEAMGYSRLIRNVIFFFFIIHLQIVLILSGLGADFHR